jgi:hypothetical protein
VTITIYALLVAAALVRTFFLLFDPYSVRGISGLGIYCISKIKTIDFVFHDHITQLFIFFSVWPHVLFGFPIACLFGMYIMILVLWYVNKRA